MQTALDRERAILNQRMAPMGGPSTGGMAQGGLPSPGGPPPPGQGGMQQLPGAVPQGQPTPGFPEALNAVFQTLMKGNEADLQMFGRMMGQLQSMVQDHEQGQGQAMPQQGIPSTP